MKEKQDCVKKKKKKFFKNRTLKAYSKLSDFFFCIHSQGKQTIKVVNK